MTKPAPQSTPQAGAAGIDPMLIPPSWVRGLAGVLSIAAFLSSLFFIYLVLIQADSKVWIASSFGFVSLLTAVMAIFSAFGAFRAGFGMAMLVFAGTFATCAVFGYFSGKASLEGDLVRQAKMWLIAHGAIGGGFALVASIAVLMRRAVAFRRLAWGVAFLLPAAAVGAVAYTQRDWLTGGGGGGDAADAAAGGEAIRIIALIVGSIAALVFISASGHWFIRAFEAGRPDDVGTERNASKAAKA